jgi:hypothetical protein
MVDWLDRQARWIPDVTTTSEWFRIRRWLPLTRDLGSTGVLTVAGQRVTVAGAIPYARPTLGSAGELVYLPSGPITADNARGKVVIRDFPAVDRGYLAEPALALDADMTSGPSRSPCC